MEDRTLTLFILSLPLSLPHAPASPADPPTTASSETAADSFNAPDNLCGWLRTMEIK